MRKHRIAVVQCAVAGALLASSSLALGQTAVPGSSVELYGLVGVYMNNSKRSGGPESALQMGHGGLTTSYWGIRGSEALGSGYKAIFAIESFFQPTTGAQGRKPGDPLFSRNAYVGFTGDFGRLTLGRQTNPTYPHEGALSPFGASTVFSPLVLQTFVAGYGGTIVGDSVWNDAVQYKTPRINGLQGAIVYAQGGDAGKAGLSNLGLHADYSNGPLTVILSAQRVRNPVVSPMSEQRAYVGGATYDFGIAKIYGSFGGTVASGITSKSRTYSAGFSVPVSKQGKILAEWARTKHDFARDVSTTRNTASLGYDYSLSKRTDVYAVYMYDKLTNFGSASTYSIGIRHRF